jgi:AcrR family transcriptional regulator
MTERTNGRVADRILEAAKSLFLDKGYFATSTRELAQASDTSESGMFRIYPNKYRILMAVYNDCWKRVNDAVEHALPKRYRDPRDQIIRIVCTIWGLYDQDRVLVRFIIMNTGNTDTLVIEKADHAEISKENMRYIHRLSHLCTESVDKGLCAPGTTSGALLEAVLGMSEGVLLGWYLADYTAGSYVPKITLKEAMVPLRALLFGWSS